MGRGGHQVTGPGKPIVERQPEQRPPRKVIPIVFVPGIAGSNLKIKPGCEQLVRERLELPEKEKLPDPWRPPNGMASGISRVNQWKSYDAEYRQTLLNPDTTVVDDGGFLEPKLIKKRGLAINPFTRNGARFRGWESVHRDSYGGILRFLEQAANYRDSVYPYEMPEHLWNEGELPIPYSSKILVDGPWSRIYGAFLDREGLSHCRMPLDQLKNIQSQAMPVFASGYNWLESNQASAKSLLMNIKRIIQAYSDALDPAGAPLYTCRQVILVTHSMGGLVARAAAAMDLGSDGEKLILGVVHGAMPAIGTPVAYRRMVAGVEPEYPGEGRIADLKNGAVVLMGRNREETTPVMGNSPGCLQLLPTGDYPKEWLVVEAPGQNGQYVPQFRTPQFDPYREIYQEEQAWYRLIDADLLDPAGILKTRKKIPWDNYLENITTAKSFHRMLKKAPRAPTYAFYGNDIKRPTYGSIRWQISSYAHSGNWPNEEEIRDAAIRIPNQIKHTRHLKLKYHETSKSKRWFDCSIQDQDTSGDGTVSWQSGRALEHYGLQGKIWPISGFKHQEAFDHEAARYFTLWAICKFLDISSKTSTS